MVHLHVGAIATPFASSKRSFAAASLSSSLYFPQLRIVAAIPSSTAAVARPSFRRASRPRRIPSIQRRRASWRLPRRSISQFAERHFDPLWRCASQSRRQGRAAGESRSRGAHRVTGTRARRGAARPRRIRYRTGSHFQSRARNHPPRASRRGRSPRRRSAHLQQHSQGAYGLTYAHGHARGRNGPSPGRRPSVRFASG